MKALAAKAYGAPGSLSILDIPTPEAGPGQIQVQIAAASINPTDLAVVTGVYASLLNVPFPYVPGNEFAGTVTDVGSGVRDYQVGDSVFGSAMPHALSAMASPDRPSLGTGALAEFAVFEADTPLITRRPSNVSVLQAASLPIAGATAYSVAVTAAAQPGATVLVIGATGGVGTAALPLLSRAGAKVFATSRQDGAGEALRALGAHEIIRPDASEYPNDLDVIINLALPAEPLRRVARKLRPGGHIVDIIWPGTSAVELGRADVRYTYVRDVDTLPGGMSDVARHAAAGTLTTTVGARYPLSEAVSAMKHFARRGTFGKVVVTMAGEDSL
ncbi:NADP-dependent oxidoreductase [Microbacterium phyllosphaerae]|uniref:NADP-dependent oxidoreductase n=1 Tax=Microbacterium phyllosphaerae TaxID=124798 RepID=UPI003D64B206